MIFITGDLHGQHDFYKLTKTKFPDTNLTKDDYLIIAGDFGLVWHDNYLSNTYLQMLDSKNYTTLFIDGNHENHFILDNLPIKKWKGGNVHYITKKIIHLMRGQIYKGIIP